MTTTAQETTTVMARLWSRMTAIIDSKRSAAARLAEESAAWETAKETRKNRQQDFDTATNEAADQHPDGLPGDVWNKLRGLHADLHRAQESFELIDRNKRRDEKLIKEQERRQMDLCDEIYGNPDKLPYSEAHGGQAIDGAGWEGVMIADLVSEMFSPHYAPLGIYNVKHAKDAFEGTLIKQAVIEEKLTKQQADYLRNELIRFLDARAVEHSLGKSKKKIELPEVAHPVKPGAPVQAGDPSAFADGGEIGVNEWEAFRSYCGAQAIAESKPVDKLVKVGDRHFVCVAVGDDYAIGAHAVPRKEYEKDHKKNVLRTEPDQQDGPEKYQGVLTAGPRAVEYVLCGSLRFTPPAE